MVPPTTLDVQAITDTQIATFFDKLSVNGVAARRSKAPAIAGGIAAHASSDMFRSPVGNIRYTWTAVLICLQGHGKPRAKRWDRTFVSSHLFQEYWDHELIAG